MIRCEKDTGRSLAITSYNAYVDFFRNVELALGQKPVLTFGVLALFTGWLLMSFEENKLEKYRVPALIFAMVFPTIVTAIYFIWLQSSDPIVQKTAFAVLKVIQFGFPIAWFWWDRTFFDHLSEKRGTSERRWTTGRGVAVGLVFGVAVGALMFAGFFFWLAKTPEGATLTLAVQEKVQNMELNSVWMYASMGVFYALIHSFLEEYYWRWFVFRGLERYCSFMTAAVLSSFAFMAHHVILLTHFFGVDSWVAYAMSLGVAVGGFAWAWIYRRSQSLLGPWLSHLLVDAAIFGLGYFLVRAVL